MKTLQCPAAITFLIHCHVSPGPFPNRDAPIYHKLIPALKEIGVITENVVYPGVYKTTPLGEAWVKALCNVPLPTMGFFDEQGRKL